MIAIAGSNEKVAWALENGADEGINHAREDVLGRTREITGGEGVEVVLDTVGGRVFGESLKLTGHGGRVVAWRTSRWRRARSTPATSIRRT